MEPKLGQLPVIALRLQTVTKIALRPDWPGFQAHLAKPIEPDEPIRTVLELFNCKKNLRRMVADVTRYTATLMMAIPRKSTGTLFVTLPIAAFVLNLTWEILQMFAYSGMTDAPWAKIIVLCSVASLGDVGITLIVFVTVALAAGTLSWAWNFRWHSYTAAALIATCYSTLTELWGLASGKWAYTPNMIVVPVLNVGLWPFLQLMLLVPLTIWIAALISRRFDEPLTSE